MLLLLLLSLVSVSYSEPDDVIVQLLYKPKDCKDIGKHGDVMHVQYLGRFYDSKKTFDSSYRRNNVPFYYTLGVGGVIEGYQIGTKDMCINERRRLIVPSKYAYGSRGTDNIPGHSTLMFDVHLVQINDSPPDYPVPLDLPMEVTASGDTSCDTPIHMGDLVEISYIGGLPDGKIFDNGTERSLKFIVGSGQILRGVEEGIVGFCPGGKIEIEIPPAKAYRDKWEGPVPQWSYVYYNVSVTSHVSQAQVEDGDDVLTCENLHVPKDCESSYKIKAGDYIDLSYKVLNKDKVELGEGEMRYPVGRKLVVPGWDLALQGACVGQLQSCWIPKSLAHKIGTSLFLAFPEKGFYTELQVNDILLTGDNKDSIDVMSTEYQFEGPVKNEIVTKTVIDREMNPQHSEL